MARTTSEPTDAQLYRGPAPTRRSHDTAPAADRTATSRGATR